ncbi:hypothetical protein EB796_003758 [Bugula neritina]|uniref:Uncharacterized protein n=1 Tax=Bugula neritina TaxID=10212 RepID=A0A7J7KH56_BUGNE|nr:hypothetical protein EB796_003758 [Bugula neritina]
MIYKEYLYTDYSLSNTTTRIPHTTIHYITSSQHSHHLILTSRPTAHTHAGTPAADPPSNTGSRLSAYVGLPCNVAPNLE